MLVLCVTLSTPSDSGSRRRTEIGDDRGKTQSQSATVWYAPPCGGPCVSKLPWVRRQLRAKRRRERITGRATPVNVYGEMSPVWFIPVVLAR